MEIVPFEEMSYENGQVAVDEVSISYVQNSDCTESNDEVQEIKLSARNNGVGRFVNIKTDNWSIDSPNDLVKLVNDFKDRAGIKE